MSMGRREITRYKQRIESLFSKVDEATGDDLELASHWACYLCVLISGLLEASIRILYGDLASSRASPEVASYVKKQLEQFRNPSFEKIFQLTQSFSPEWAQRLKSGVGQEVEFAVNSIVTNRHNIAHGRSVTLTVVQLKQYYQSVVKLIDAIAELLGATSGNHGG